MSTYAKLDEKKKKQLAQNSKAYNAAHYKQIGVNLHREYDADVIARLSEKPSMAGYIKELVRADVKREKAKVRRMAKA